MGSWALYLALSALVNCENPDEAGDSPEDIARPCGLCRNCRNVLSHNFEGMSIAVALPPLKKSDDVTELTNEVIEIKRTEPFALLAASGSRNISIAVARQIKRRLALKAPSGIVRTVLFHQMEYMRTSSADALLKMIEEPPPNTIIIMTARRPEVLLPTIRSRAQQIRLDRIDEQKIETYLIERHSVDRASAHLLSRLSEGSLGAALEKVTNEDSLAFRQGVLDLFVLLVDGTGSELVSRLHETINLRNRSEVEQLLAVWQSLLRDCLNYSVTGSDTDFTNPDFVDPIKRLSSQLSGTEGIDTMLHLIKMTLADLRLNVHIPGALAALTTRMQAVTR